jgi:hypothetical protein
MSIIRVDYQLLDEPDSNPIVTVQQSVNNNWLTVVSEQTMNPIVGQSNAFFLDVRGLIIPGYDYFYSVTAFFSTIPYVTAGENRVEDITGAVWDELAADHSIAGSMGQIISSLGPVATILSGLTTAGNGIVLVHDKVVDCNGVGVPNCRISAFLSTDLTTTVAVCRSNSDGCWALALNPGVYLIRVEGCGDALNLVAIVTTTSVTFGCKNTSSPQPFVPSGSTLVLVSDRVVDCNNTGIPNVKVTAYHKEDLATIVQSTVTNNDGVWTMSLNVGEYLLVVEGCGDPMNLWAIVQTSGLSYRTPCGPSTFCSN